MRMFVILFLRCGSGFISSQSSEVKDTHRNQGDASVQRHRAENARLWQVGRHPAAEMEIQDHTAPEQEQNNAGQVRGESLRIHNSLVRAEEWQDVESERPRDRTAGR